jgi:ArsR family transcriptional regulator
MNLSGNKKENISLLELAEMLKAMSHPARISIMHLICCDTEKRLTVKFIYQKLDMSQPVISRHLGILKNSGLVERVSEGQLTFYQLCDSNETVNLIAGLFSSLKINK